MSDTPSSKTIDALLRLSHEAGLESRGMAILGEGNASIRGAANTFWIKASGACMGTLKPGQVVECNLDKVLAMLDLKQPTDAEINQALLDSRVDSSAMKPSVEAVFHAFLLSLPEVSSIGHVHSIAVNQILCSPRAKDFAEKRMFPDEIVCCGTESALVPYIDPGLPLAAGIRDATLDYIKRIGTYPRVILLENHGIIALGTSPDAVLATLLMAEKAAKIFVGAAALGGPIFLSEKNAQRIAQRPDEHYRQRALNL